MSGEVVAWVVGWSLILEYSLVVSAVAVGWSGYATGFLASIGLPLPAAISAGLHAGAIVNLPAVLIVFAVTGLPALGTKESATVKAALFVAKIVALLLFVAVAARGFDMANFVPFMPYGFAGEVIDGRPHRVMAAAAVRLLRLLRLRRHLDRRGGGAPAGAGSGDRHRRIDAGVKIGDRA